MRAVNDEACRVVIEPDRCDLQEATYDPRLSSAGRDDGQHVVYTTVDRVVYQPAPDVVEKILDANGYSMNLENILAVLDEVKIGYRLQVSNEPLAPNSVPIAKTFLPALTLRLPMKNRVGPLLAKFYAEVGGYQNELVRLREQAGRAHGGQRKELEDLRREHEKLKAENEQLRTQVDSLNAELGQLRKSHAAANHALAEQNILPAQVRVAQVHKVDLEERYVALKSGRKVFSVPLVAIWVYPEKDEPCLVSIQDGEVSGVFFHEGAQPIPGMVLGEVLHVAEGQCKVREENRRTRVIQAQNPAEKELISQMRRGDRVLLFLHNDELLRFVPCGTFNAEAFARAVQESIARWEIAQSEEQGSDGTGPV
ncbi:MAG: hypothetical protein KTR25_14905 [Myxococcales bacterium]|nr:hypothetical protein [Myxococcales bacterium]